MQTVTVVQIMAITFVQLSQKVGQMRYSPVSQIITKDFYVVAVGKLLLQYFVLFGIILKKLLIYLFNPVY